MNKISFVAAAVAFVVGLAIATSVFASGVALTGIGGRATALGGCYRGVSDDWSAMLWNPAGLTQIMGMQFGGSVEMIVPRASYTPAKWNNMPFSAARGGETEGEPREFYVPSAGMAYGLETMAFGLGVFAPFGLGSKWDLLDTSTYNALYPSMDFEDRIQVIDIHPTFAYNVNDRLSAGIGLSIVYADILIRTPTFTPNPYFQAEFELFREGLLVPRNGMNPEFNHLLTESELEGDGLGYGGNVGLMFHATDDLQVGVSARYYADISLEGKVDATTYFATNSDCHDIIEAVLEPSLMDSVVAGSLSPEQYGALVNYYSGGTNVKHDNEDAEAKLPLPMNVGIGLAYYGIDNVVASFDVDWTQWSTWEVIEIDMAGGDKSELVERWDDTIRIGVGLEYALDNLKLRAAFYTEPSAVPDETMGTTIPDVNRRNVLNLGVGYQLGNIALNAGYRYSMISDREVASWKPSADTRDYDNMAGLYKMKAHNAILGLEYSF